MDSSWGDVQKKMVQDLMSSLWPQGVEEEEVVVGV